MFSFCLRLINWILTFFLRVIFGVAAFAVILGFVIYFAQEKPAEIRPKSFLVIDWDMGLSDEPTMEDSLVGRIARKMKDTGDDVLGIWEIHEALERAATDDRICGVLMMSNVSETTAGLAQLYEVREALKAFKASGKPVYGYAKTLLGKDYYLLSTADHLWMHPKGFLVFSGIAMESPFFAEAMQKQGIGFQEARVGAYKSALEPFTRKDLSSENRLAQQMLLDDLWGEMMQSVMSQRIENGLSFPLTVMNAPIWIGESVFEKRWVDGLYHMDQVIDLLAKKSSWDEDLNSFSQVNIADYLKESVGIKKSMGPQIAIVYAEGNIVDGKGRFSQIGGDRLAYKLRSLRYDDDIAGVVLRIDSGGGSALASEVISREVGLLSQKKPLAVSFGNVAASGGYWIATEAPYIVATPLTITGSIGDFSFMANIQSLANRYGVYFDGVKTGPFAGSFQTFTRPHSDEEMDHLQLFVEQGYRDFIEKVTVGRKGKIQDVEAIAQGRVWAGIRAQKLGLVDELGGIKQAVEYVRHELGVANYEILHMGPDYSLYEQIAHYGKSWMPVGQVFNQISQVFEFTKDYQALDL